MKWRSGRANAGAADAGVGVEPADGRSCLISDDQRPAAMANGFERSELFCYKPIDRTDC